MPIAFAAKNKKIDWPMIPYHTIPYRKIDRPMPQPKNDHDEPASVFPGSPTTGALDLDTYTVGLSRAFYVTLSID